MNNKENLQNNQDDMNQIYRLIFQNMNEGLMVIGNDGKIILTNPRAAEILEKDPREMNRCPFARLFYGDERNDAFNQTILDAIYDKENVQNNHVTLTTDTAVKKLNVITSGLHDGKSIIGVIVVLSDVTEFVDTKLKNEYAKKALGQYLSESIAEEVLKSPDALNVGGNKEEVTIIMSDLRGFTAMCEQLHPDELMALLNHYLKIMGRIIKEHSGTIIEYIGDGILAIFGAPIPAKNHALKAVKCAIKMQLAMEEVNAWNREHGYPELNMGIGVNTGEAVVGNVGSEYTMKYNVIGSSVNLCGRIESYTVDNQIFISPSTKEQLPYDLMIDEVQNISPKGVRNSLEIYSIYGIKGPVPLSYNKPKDDIEIYDNSVKAVIVKIESKHIMEEEYPCIIRGASINRILIDSVAEGIIADMDNILVKTDEKLYCKVLRKTADGWLLAVTGRMGK